MSATKCQSTLRNILEKRSGLRGGADKSLARPTFPCRRTESIVSLERGVCSWAELQVFSCYRGWKEACQATRAISATSRRELSSSFFLMQGKAPKEIHAIPIETLGEHAPSYATVKNWVAQFKRGDFSTCDAPRPVRPKTVTTPEIIDRTSRWKPKITQTIAAYCKQHTQHTTALNVKTLCF